MTKVWNRDQARLPRRAEERAEMIRWLKEMLLLNILLVP